MEIQNSLQFVQIESALLQQISQISDWQRQKEAKKVLDNISKMNTQLSKLELEARRSASHSLRKVNEQVEKINTELHNLEQWIMLLMLS
jgi:hypothetical protein